MHVDDKLLDDKKAAEGTDGQEYGALWVALWIRKVICQCSRNI